MSMTDAHCHLSLLRDAQAQDEYLKKGRAAGIERWLMAGYEESDWQKQRELQKRYPKEVFCCFGIHPWRVMRLEEKSWAKEMKRLEEQAPQASLIGETGFDFFKAGGRESEALQMQSFRAHLELAARLNKPVVLHIVHGHGEAIPVLKEFKGRLRGIVHAFSGAFDLAQEYLRLGYWISIGPQLLSPRFKKLRETASLLEANQFVIETDNPWEQEQQARPDLLLEVANELAQLRGVSAREIWPSAEANLERLLKL